jgi:hypothetical protein
MLIYILSYFIVLLIIVIIFNKNFRIYIIQNKSHTVMMFLCLFGLVIVLYFVFIVIFDDTDRCLDSGGSWDRERNVCLH